MCLKLAKFSTRGEISDILLAKKKKKKKILLWCLESFCKLKLCELHCGALVAFQWEHIMPWRILSCPAVSFVTWQSGMVLWDSLATSTPKTNLKIFRKTPFPFCLNLCPLGLTFVCRFYLPFSLNTWTPVKTCHALYLDWIYYSVNTETNVW